MTILIFVRIVVIPLFYCFVGKTWYDSNNRNKHVRNIIATIGFIIVFDVVGILIDELIREGLL